MRLLEDRQPLTIHTSATEPPLPLTAMTLNEVRAYTKQVIAALHAAGWHTEGFALGNDLIGIGYQPLPTQYLMVLDDAERLAEELEANGFGVPSAA